MSGGARRALFLDRDGVINVDTGYVHRPEDFRFCEGIFELVRHAHRQGWAVVVVTNQAGIGRGYYTEAQFQDLTRWMLAEFARRDAPIDRVFHCPDHPDHGAGPYRRESPLRKPNPGMLLLAAKELGLSLPHSVLVGDKESDITAGRRAGVGRNLRVDWPAGAEPAPARTSADRIVTSLAEVMDEITPTGDPA